MDIRLLSLLALLIALAIPATPARATPVPADLPIPRIYPTIGIPRADPEKPTGQRAREEAQADTYEIACKGETGARTGTDRWAACADLGRAYYFGEGRPQSRPVAELLFRRACDGGSGAGCFDLGNVLAETESDDDKLLANLFYTRACMLGMLNGCDAEADALALGTFAEPDVQAADTLRRATCERGGQAACRTLAGLLIGPDSSRAEQGEGRALLDRQCRAGDMKACEDAAAHWYRLIEYGSAARFAEYQQLACAAGSAQSCDERGRAVLNDAYVPDDPVRVAALQYFDRACVLDEYYCTSAAHIRAEPLITSQCDSGDQAACLTLGEMLADAASPVGDKMRALAVLGAGCDAGATKACWPAARLLIDQSRANIASDPARLESYLYRSCTSGERAVCETLADLLAKGDLLQQDEAAAATLYVDICENAEFFGKACDFLTDYGARNAAAPLVLAKADFGPELTPEEVEQEAEQKRQLAEQRKKEIQEDFKRACTTTTVMFEGQSYSDTLCVPVVRVIRGFTVTRGKAPWQALLWRPPVLGQVGLVPAQQVLCGGSLVSEGWILTAAHCLTDEGLAIDKAGHRVRLGLNNPLTDEGFSYPILRAIPHPDYKRDVLAFDIALVQYDTRRGTRGRTATAPARVRLDPLPLEQRKLETLEPVMTFGWGVTKVGTGLIPDHLRGARLRLRDRATCTGETKFKDSKRRDSVLCADDTKAADGGQACNGDSGGPLVSYGDVDRVPTIIGVVSGGKDCGTAGKPSRYIRVAHPRIRQWLAQYLPMVRPR